MSKYRTIVYPENYPEHPILGSRERNQPCDRKILDKIEAIFDDALATHTKVLVFRYDVRTSHESANKAEKELFSKGQADVVKYLTRKGLDPQYIAVRESSKDDGFHYHVVMALNASKTQNPYGHLEKAEEIFERKSGLQPTGKHGVVDFCDRDRNGNKVSNSYIVHRDNKEEYDEAFKRASYLAKVATKPNDGEREMFSSERKRNP